MSDIIQRPATVTQLACARFEDALAEGVLDGRALAHLAECEACRALRDDVGELTSAIAELSAPVQVLPTTFVEGVIEQAELMEGRRFAPSTERSFSGWAWACAGFAAAAALATVLWLTNSDNTKPSLLRAEHRPETSGNVSSKVLSETQMWETAPVLSPSAERLDRVAPVVSDDHEALIPSPVLIPERPVNLPGELHNAIMRELAQNTHCPESSFGTLRVTCTVNKDGRLANRTILSTGSAEAHRCANEAMDRLLLPPQKTDMQVTLELSW